MNIVYKKISLVCALLVTFGCSQGQKTFESEFPSTGNSGSGQEVTEVEGVENGSPLYFQLGIRWETTVENAAYSTVKTCSFSRLSTQTTQTCSIQIPEAQLYYSDLNFKIGSLDKNSCPVIKFTPYAYTRSTTDYQPDPNALPSATDITCGTVAMVNGCYGGAAPAMITDYPKQTGFYYLTNVKNENSETLKSENSLNRYFGYNVNYLVTNDKADYTTAVTGAETAPNLYIASTMKDYTITCEDYWGATLYTMTLKISDQNTSSSTTGPTDHYPDWP